MMGRNVCFEVVIWKIIPELYFYPFLSSGAVCMLLKCLRCFNEGCAFSLYIECASSLIKLQKKIFEKHLYLTRKSIKWS